MASPADPTVERVNGDLEAGMRRILAASDADELRRALIETFTHLYSWSEHERDRVEARTGKRPDTLASVDPTLGKYVDALLLWRIVIDHKTAQLVALRDRDTIPSEKLFPSEWLFPGANVCFTDWADTPELIRGAKYARRDTFRDHLAGTPVLPWLDVARESLSSMSSQETENPSQP